MAPNSCWSPYTPLWGEALFLQSQAVQRKPFPSLFPWRLSELSDLEWTGPGVLSRSSLGPCFPPPGSDLEAALCFASRALEPLGGIKTSDRVYHLPARQSVLVPRKCCNARLPAALQTCLRGCLRLTAPRGCCSAQGAAVGPWPPERIKRGRLSIFTLHSAHKAVANT